MSNPLSITVNPLLVEDIDMGVWRDVECLPMYEINSTGLVMNKRTLKILKHFRFEETREPSVTLYRAKVGHALSVQALLDENFPGSILSVPKFRKEKLYSKQPQDTNDLFLDD